MNLTTNIIEVNPQVTQYQILADQVPISFQNWIDLMKTSTTFIQYYSNLLRNSPFQAFFWEVKPVVKNNLQDPFEFVLVNSTALTKIQSDDSFFKSYFKKGKEVVSFPNLGGDAQLVVPTHFEDFASGCENSRILTEMKVSNLSSRLEFEFSRSRTHYNHLANFIRHISNNQIVKFWQEVAVTYEKEIGTNAKWLSTSGLGVYWLHVRIDSRPKYYQFVDYKSKP